VETYVKLRISNPTRVLDNDPAVLDLPHVFEPSDPAFDRGFDRWARKHPLKRDRHGRRHFS